MGAEFDDFSDAAKAVREFFTSELATHVFFVEDTGTETFYERFFSKLFPKLLDFSVSCLHGKSNVNNKAKEKRDIDVQYVFLVDKDFSDLLDDSFHEDVAVLDQYSIENYLADISALIKVLVEEFPHHFSEQSARAACDDLDVYLTTLSARLIQMTRYFVVAQRLGGVLPSSKLSVEEILADSEPVYPAPSAAWLSTYRAQLLAETGMPIEDLDAEVDLALLPPVGSALPIRSPEAHVPGKHFLGCLVRYVSVRTAHEFATQLGDRLHIRLLNHIDAGALNSVRDLMIAKNASLAALT
jgi:hypothetical protein